MLHPQHGAGLSFGGPRAGTDLADTGRLGPPKQGFGTPRSAGLSSCPVPSGTAGQSLSQERFSVHCSPFIRSVLGWLSLFQQALTDPAQQEQGECAGMERGSSVPPQIHNLVFHKLKYLWFHLHLFECNWRNHDSF